jgi:hypothetical protein
MFRVHLLLQQYEDVKEELDPHQEAEDDENAAAMNTTFFLYVIKDVLEFNGLYPETTPAREIRNALYKFEVLTAKNEQLTKVLAQLE